MRIVALGDADALDVAAAALEAGDPVVVPTDTVYGVALPAEAPDAAARLAATKDRPDDQPVAVLVADRAQAEEAGVVEDDGATAALVDAFWPGPLTVVVRRRRAVGWSLGEPGDTIGLRHPDARFVIRLAARVGPLAVTSANRHGFPPSPEAAAAAEALSSRPAVAVDGGSLAGLASTVVDLTATPPRVLRAGALDLARLRKVVPDTAG